MNLALLRYVIAVLFTAGVGLNLAWIFSNGDILKQGWIQAPVKRFSVTVIKSSKIKRTLRSNLEMPDASSVYRERQNSIEHFCTLESKTTFSWPYLNSSWRPDVRKYSRIYVDDKHKFLYCKIPKVACSNMLRLMVGLRGVEDPFHIPSREFWEKSTNLIGHLGQVTSEEALYKLKHYTKFIIVRDPFERLYSAYRNKLGEKGQQDFFKRYGREILQMFHSDWDRERIDTGQGVLFNEFLQYVLGGAQNEHWESYYKLCFPCEINYNFVAKFESLEEDVNYFLKHIGADKNIQWPKRNVSYKARPTAEVMREGLKNVSFGLASDIAKLYRNDFGPYDYSPAGTFEAIDDDTT